MLQEKIIICFEWNRNYYGTPRLKFDLLEEEGVSVSRNRISRLIRSAYLQAYCKWKFRVTTKSKHAHPIAENVLNREFKASGPNQKRVTDITYLLCTDALLYLATVLELYSRKIAGCVMGEGVKILLVTEALQIS